MIELAPSLAAAGVGAGVGLGMRRMFGRGRGHRHVLSPPGRRGAGRVATQPRLDVAWSPGVAVAPLAVLALARPWGPLPDTLAAPVAALAASATALAGGQFAKAWRRRRMRDLFPDWLATLAMALSLGVPLGTALGLAASATDLPLAMAARRLADRAEAGAEDALAEFAHAIGTTEASFVASVLERHRHLGVSVASVLLEEEGLLSRLRWQERRGRQGLVPYAFTAGVGVLLVNAAVLFLAPRAAELLTMLDATRP